MNIQDSEWRERMKGPMKGAAEGAAKGKGPRGRGWAGVVLVLVKGH